ncbi:hypothetical protein RB195_009009 [Necator americanus]
MQDVVTSQTTNGTENSHWLNDPKRKNLLFSVVAVGQLIGTIPIVPVMQKIGLRYTYTFYGLVAAFTTLSIPLAVEFGHFFVALARVLQGFALGVAFVTVGAITSHWSVLRESGTYIAILSCSPQLSSVISMPLASAFCESSLGWRYLYYTLGAAGLLFSTTFFLFYEDDPKNHRMVSSRELSAITTGKEQQSEREKVPYKKICADRCMQAVLFTTFSGNTAFFTFLHFGPTFMNMTLGFDITETGYSTALPYALCVLLKIIAGPLFDILTFIPEKYRLIMFASVSQGAMAICFCVLSQSGSRLMAQAAYSGAVAFNGLNIVGSIKCAQMVARQHVHFVMVCITITGCIISFILPGIVAVLCPHNTVHEWSRLFLGISVFVVFANIPFLFLARSEPAPWTKSTPNYRLSVDQSFRSTAEAGKSIVPPTVASGRPRDATQEVSVA